MKSPPCYLVQTDLTTIYFFIWKQTLSTSFEPIKKVPAAERQKSLCHFRDYISIRHGGEQYSTCPPLYSPDIFCYQRSDRASDHLLHSARYHTHPDSRSYCGSRSEEHTSELQSRG